MDRGSEDTAGSRAGVDTSTDGGDSSWGSAEAQGWDKLSAAQGIAGVGRVHLGREFLGRWLLCREGLGAQSFSAVKYYLKENKDRMPQG